MVKKPTIIISIILLFSFSSLSMQYNPAEAKLKVIKIADKFYKLQCISGTYVNTLACVGNEGILLVDTGYPQTSDLLKKEIKKLGDGNVRILINTHEHNDHISGNDEFAQEAVIISHERVRRAYGGEYFALKSIHRSGIPQIVFDKEMTIFFNDEEIKLKHYPGGHTLGDCIVYFENSKIAFVGDMIFADCFPGADIARGGDLKICLANVQKIMEDYPDDTIFINGHGPDYTKKDLKKYLEVGILTERIIKDELKKGKTVDEILASNVLDRWEKWGQGVVTQEDWINTVYQQYLKDNSGLKVSICQPLTQAIMNEEISNVISLYKQLRQNEADQYDFAEDQLNNLGYRLMDRGMIEEAIEIFRLNVEQYPQSGNAYDSLAEAYMNNGNKELAIKYYLKSLEKDPQNDNAKGMLKRLGYKKK